MLEVSDFPNENKSIPLGSAIQLFKSKTQTLHVLMALWLSMQFVFGYDTENVAPIKHKNSNLPF